VRIAAFFLRNCFRFTCGQLSNADGHCRRMAAHLSGRVADDSVPEAPGAPAVILYRQVDRDDSARTGNQYNYVRIKI